MFVVRSSSRARLQALKKRVFHCFEAGVGCPAALMSQESHIAKR